MYPESLRWWSPARYTCRHGGVVAESGPAGRALAEVPARAPPARRRSCHQGPSHRLLLSPIASLSAPAACRAVKRRPAIPASCSLEAGAPQTRMASVLIGTLFARSAVPPTTPVWEHQRCIDGIATVGARMFGDMVRAHRGRLESRRKSWPTGAGQRARPRQDRVRPEQGLDRARCACSPTPSGWPEPNGTASARRLGRSRRLTPSASRPDGRHRRSSPRT